MRTLPNIPDSIRQKVGQPVKWFGPNRSFRFKSTILGSILIVLGVVSVVIAVAFPIAGPAARPIYWFLGGGLLLMGCVSIVMPWSWKPNGFLVGKTGLARFWNGSWESVTWAEIGRVEDISIRGRISVEQFQIMLVNGKEWGFMSNHIGDGERLIEMIRDKITSR